MVARGDLVGEGDALRSGINGDGRGAVAESIRIVDRIGVAVLQGTAGELDGAEDTEGASTGGIRYSRGYLKCASRQCHSSGEGIGSREYPGSQASFGQGCNAWSNTSSITSIGKDSREGVGIRIGSSQREVDGCVLSSDCWCAAQGHRSASGGIDGRAGWSDREGTVGTASQSDVFEHASIDDQVGRRIGRGSQTAGVSPIGQCVKGVGALYNADYVGERLGSQHGERSGSGFAKALRASG